jgi:hypothetical protein
MDPRSWKLIQRCRIKGVILTAQALRDARDYFRFSTQSDVIQFIADGGLEDVVFKKTDPLDHWDGDPPPPDVHVFKFRTGQKEGYLAYYQGPVLMVIKSFKPDNDPPQRRPPIRALKR